MSSKGQIWMAREIELWPVDRLRPFERNPRVHPERKIELLVENIRSCGFTVPIAVRHGTIIAGHARLEAARRAGLETVPVIRLDHLTDEQAKAYVIWDNRATEDATWDDALLAELVGELDRAGFDIALTGLGEEDLERLLQDVESAPPPVGDEDDAPEPAARAVTRPGDLWILGRHRLLCGDATSATDVARLLGDARPHLMVTDPPYGVEYDPGWRNEAGVSSSDRTGRVSNDDRADWREAWALFPGDVAYVWHAGIHAGVVAESLMACDFSIRAQIIWCKPRFALSRGHYHWQHEPCWYAVRDGRESHWQGARDQATVWHIGRDGELDPKTVHGTQKPVECMRRPILNSSAPGDAVYEPFCGSGSTLIACETTGRVCYALELDPAYCDVIVRRWQAFTGQKAVLDGDGTPFDEAAAAVAD